MNEDMGRSWAEAAVASLGDGILIVDADNKIVSINEEMQQIWNFPTEAVENGCSVSLAHSVQEMLVNPEAFMAHVGQVGSFSEPELDDLHFRDGRIIERSARLVRGPDQCVGRILVFRDVTKRRQAEEHRRLMANRLQAAQKIESLGVLAGGIAHEFNNMLMVILGNADLLHDELLSKPENEESLNEIKIAGRRAADLCNQMLAFAGKGRFVIEPANLQKIIVEMQGILNISIGKMVHLHCNFAENLPSIDVDMTQVRQVIMNLVTNASEACIPTGGDILLAVKVSDLSKDYLADCVAGENLTPGPYLVMEVADSGKGMGSDVLDRVFEPFFSTNFAGRGLGLPAVLGIMRGHRGGVRIESIPGRGSLVSVFFPFSEARDMELSNKVLHSAPPLKKQGKILLVDDEKTILRVAVLVLERAGFTVETALNGREALDILEVRRPEFSCVVMDLTMPVMDGLECSKIIKEQWIDLPLILSSGYTEAEATISFGDELSGFLHKPYITSKLIEMVKKWADR